MSSRRAKQNRHRGRTDDAVGVILTKSVVGVEASDVLNNNAGSANATRQHWQHVISKKSLRTTRCVRSREPMTRMRPTCIHLRHLVTPNFPCIHASIHPTSILI